MENKTAFARKLRTHQTDAEKILWLKLRSRQLDNIKFRRQQQIGNYIVDFVSFEKMVIIELDGSQHMLEKAQRYDDKRTRYLQSLGYTVIRFWDNEILRSLNTVLESIHLTLTFSSKEREDKKR